MWRANIRSHLQTSGVLDLPRLVLSGADLIDISAGQSVYRPDEMPKIHVLIGQESSEENTLNLSRQIRSALMVITVYISSYDSSWRPYRSYYDSDVATTRPYMSYDEASKDDLRSDLEEIAQEVSYRLRRDDLSQLDGVLSVYDQSTSYNISLESGVTVGTVTMQFEIKYYT